MYFEPRQILNSQGYADPPGPDKGVLRTRYIALVEARLYDRNASALQRQGRLATYAPYEGQEAIQIGAVAQLQPAWHPDHSYGTSAILSVGRSHPRPVVRDGAVAIAHQFPLSLSYDHRIIDGAEGRRFMAAVTDALES